VETLEESVAGPRGIDIAWLLRWLQQASLQVEQLRPPLSSPRAIERRLQIHWLHELLEGTTDADRWDYLWRDTLHLGFTSDHEDIRDALQDFKDDVRVLWYGDRSRLVVGEDTANLLGETFFSLRSKLYRRVYENPEKRIIDGILVRCIYLSLLSLEPDIADPGYRDFLINFVHITDSELLSILEREPDSPLGAVIAQLVRELRTYPAVRVAWERTLRPEEYRDTTTLEQFTYTGANPPRLTESAELEAILRATKANLQVRSRADSAGGERWKLRDDHFVESLALHCGILPIRPVRLLQFERLVWRLACHELEGKPEGKGVVPKILRALIEPMPKGVINAASDDQIEDSVDKCPPIFVAFPWLSDFSEPSIRAMTRDSNPPKLLVRQADGTLVERVPADLMPRSRGGEGCIAVGGYPLYTTRHLSMAERDAFDHAIHEAVERLIEQGCCLALPRSFTGAESDSQILDYLIEPLGRAS
jgi:hypothetical protein